MTRWLRMTAALLLLVILFTACGAPAAPATEPVSGETFTDCAGREVSIPNSTERIACLYAYTGHVAVLLGCEDQIVAVVDGLKRDALMQQKIPNIDEMPSPYSSGAINIEELAATAPDMIFLRASNLQDAGEMEKLDGLGIPYAVVEYETMEDQMESIAVMGEALGHQEQAEAYLQYYEDTMNMVRQRLEDLPDSQRKTVYHSVNEVVRADIPGTLSYEVLEAAGCRNVVTDAAELQLDGDKGYVTVEQIYVWDPDIILANEPAAVEYFRTDDKFSGLRAVREGQVLQLPVGISRWAHPGSLESPLATLYLAATLYPDRFADVDLRAEIREFYETFFRISLSESDIDTILSGEGMRAPREGADQ